MGQFRRRQFVLGSRQWRVHIQAKLRPPHVVQPELLTPPHCRRSIRRAAVFAVLRPFIPIGVCSAISLVSGNWAYRYAPVTFLQTIKAPLSIRFGATLVKPRAVRVLTRARSPGL